MIQYKDGYVRLLDEISTDDLIIMEADSSSFNLARFLINNTSVERVFKSDELV